VQSDSEGVAITLDQGERLLKPKQGNPCERPCRIMFDHIVFSFFFAEEDGSQQAAEAMVQLSGAIGFYTQPQGLTIISKFFLRDHFLMFWDCFHRRVHGH
jgi:hypothetical protein